MIEVEPDERLVDEPDLRDADRPFADRADAGRALARLLAPWGGSDAVVVGLLPGGAVVAATSCRALRLTGVALSVPPDAPAHPLRPVPLEGRTVLVVSDGIATGRQVRAALRAVRDRGAAIRIVAAATAPLSVAEALLADADRVVVARLGLHGDFSVAAAYRSFGPVDEARAIALLGPGGDAAPIDNEAVATVLDEVARRLAALGGNPFRVRAWIDGAAVVRSLDEPVAELLAREGRLGLEALPHVGEGLASAIDEIVHTGTLSTLGRLQGDDPVTRLSTVPGLGVRLATAIVRELGVEDLDGLGRAAADGRLASIPGIGPHRLELIRHALEAAGQSDGGQ